MHFCCVLITEEFPTDEVITKKLSPYDEEAYYEQDEEERPWVPLLWDWWQVGGRYSGLLKLSTRDNQDRYDWGYYARVPRNGRLFRSYALDRMKTMADLFFEEDYYPSMGYRDGFLYVDGGLVDDLKWNEEFETFGYYLIDKNENVYSVEVVDLDSGKIVKNENYAEEFRKVISESSGCYMCIVDLHD